jgi:hypothetical protein
MWAAARNHFSLAATILTAQPESARGDVSLFSSAGARRTFLIACCVPVEKDATMMLAKWNARTQRRLCRRTVFSSIVVAMSMLTLVTPAAAIDATWQLNGDGNWNTAGNWDIGVVPDNNLGNQYDVRIDNDTNFNVIVSLNVSLDVRNLTVDAGDALSFVSGMDLEIDGTSVTNNGVISLNGAGSATELVFAGASVTLSGSGVLTMGGAAVNHITGGAATQLINSSTHTIAGGGQLGFNQLVLTNQGTIDANIGGAGTRG